MHLLFVVAVLALGSLLPAAAFAPDGASIFYAASQGELNRVMEQPVEGQGGAAILLESDREITPFSVSAADGTLLLDYEREDGKYEVRKLLLDDGDGEPTVLASAVDENMGGGMYSPDGRWVSYTVSIRVEEDNSTLTETWVVPADGSDQPQRVLHRGQDVSSPSWTDESRLRVEDTDGNVWLFRDNSVGSTGSVFT